MTANDMVEMVVTVVMLVMVNGVSLKQMWNKWIGRKTTLVIDDIVNWKIGCRVVMKS